MIHDPNDKTLDEYLERDSAVSQQYRNLGSDDVPPALDSAVLAQARAALNTQASRRPAWTRWSAPLALAASVVLGIAVVLEIGVEERATFSAPQAEQAQEADASESNVAAIEQVTQQVPVAAPDAVAPSVAPKAESLRPAQPAPAEPARQRAKADAAASAEKREELRADASAAEDSRRLLASEARPVAPPPASAVGELQEAVQPEPQAASTGASQAADSRATKALQDQTFAANREPSTARGAPPSGVRRTSASSQVFNAFATPRLEPVKWLEQIRALRVEGKILEADEQWRRFVEAYPDFLVAADDAARPTAP